jgi:hypothetical protein
MSFRALQAVPLNLTAPPAKSTATQNDAEAQDTELRVRAPSTSSGALQAVPVKVKACPAESTATQNDADGHDTELSASAPSMFSGAPHALPLKVRAFPAESTATQNEADGHDTDASGEESTEIGGDQSVDARATVGTITSMITADSTIREAYGHERRRAKQRVKARTEA